MRRYYKVGLGMLNINAGSGSPLSEAEITSAGHVMRKYTAESTGIKAIKVSNSLALQP